MLEFIVKERPGKSAIICRSRPNGKQLKDNEFIISARTKRLAERQYGEIVHQRRLQSQQDLIVTDSVELTQPGSLVSQSKIEEGIIINDVKVGAEI